MSDDPRRPLDAEASARDGADDLSSPPGDAQVPGAVIVAIDGPAGSGKSTVARLLAARIGGALLDTGAMYRAVTWAALARGVALDDLDAVHALADHLRLEVNEGAIAVDGTDVSEAIRSAEVDEAVSIVAANQGVREVLVARQRRWTAEHEVAVVEGRDIGTVVLPHADLKVYLTATVHERARRRSRQRAQPADEATVAAMAAALARRDARDSGRRYSPLMSPEDVAADAVVIDSTDLAPQEIVDLVLARWEPRAHPQVPVEDTTGRGEQHPRSHLHGTAPEGKMHEGERDDR